MQIIKKTKSVEIEGDEKGLFLWVIGQGSKNTYLPMKVIFQVKRGLESYIQKFYRKRKVK